MKFLKQQRILLKKLARLVYSDFSLQYYLYSHIQEVPLVTACVFPGGRHTNATEKVCNVNIRIIIRISALFLTILLSNLIKVLSSGL